MKNFPVMTMKFKKWVNIYLDSSSDAFGNATEAAARVYNVKNRASAANIGYENVRKLDFLLPVEAEKIGHTLPRLLKELHEAAGDDFYKLERYIVRLGYFPPKP